MSRHQAAWEQGVLTANPWQDLRLGRRHFPERGYAMSPRDYRLESGLRFTYGLSEAGCPSLFVEWPTGGTIPENLQTNTLRLDISTMPGWRALRIECRDPTLEDVFWRFVQALLTILQQDKDGNDALSAFLQAYEEFMDLLRDPSRSSDVRVAQIIGLAGELYTLLQLLRAARAPAPVEAWHGPLGAARDFVFMRAELEVKTHLGEAPRALPISSIYQLSRTGTAHVFINLVHFTPGSAWTIDSLIAHIRRELAADEQQLFTEKLKQIGYVDQTAPQWNRIAVDLYGQWYFEVRDDFPRIAPEILTCPDFARHFLATKYDLDITALSSFEVTPEEVYTLIRSTTH